MRRKDLAFVDKASYIADLPANPPEIDLSSSGFAYMRTRDLAFVDKTSYIADLLCSTKTRHALFVRPRRFGKSLTLEIMAQLLRAGELPAGVAAWGGYKPVDVDTMFKGLAVYDRLKGEDPSDEVLHRAHFVIHLSLVTASTGSEVEADILSQLDEIARAAFGDEVGDRVLSQKTPGGALRTLLSEVPKGVPTAVLVDEYDATIVQDLGEGNWDAADTAIELLRSLLAGSKAAGDRADVDRFVMTGIARLTHTLLASGATTFNDITADPMLCRAIGFRREEIAATFSDKLKHMRVAARSAPPFTIGVDSAARSAEEVSLDALEWWFDGYCFDGKTTCFNPIGVLQTLHKGKLQDTILEASTSDDWLGLKAHELVNELWQQDTVQPRMAPAHNIDMADFANKSVNVRALLAQIGLLTLQPDAALPDANSAGGMNDAALGAGKGKNTGTGSLLYQVPNEYARLSLQAMMSTALPGVQLGTHVPTLIDSLKRFDAREFEAVVKTVLQALPYGLLAKAKPETPRSEAPFHAALWALLHCCVPVNVASVLVTTATEEDVQSGRANIVIKFARQPVVWILELGFDSAAAVPRDDSAATLEQARTYAAAYSVKGVEVVCCAVNVSKVPAASTGDTAAPVYAAELCWEVVQHSGNNDGPWTKGLPSAPAAG